MAMSLHPERLIWMRWRIVVSEGGNGRAEEYGTRKVGVNTMQIQVCN